MVKKVNKMILTGYRKEGIDLYKTRLKPLGYVVASVGFVCLGVAMFPNGLGVVFYPLGFGLLGVVGISTLMYEKKVRGWFKFMLWKLKRCYSEVVR